jgi:hypothetical protein
MKSLFYLFTILVVICGCKKDCFEPPIVKFPSTISGYYYDSGQSNGFNSSIESFDFILTYDSKGKIIRRNGYKETTEFSPNNIQTVENYDSLSYKDDSIFIFNKWHNLTFNTFSVNNEYIVVYNENGILRRIMGNYYTENFYYNKNNRMDSSYLLIEYAPGIRAITNAKKYCYSNEGNLIEIKYVNTDFGTEPNVIKSGSQIFSGFDNADNPFKGLWMFDDMFLRSVSNNNYTKQDNNEWIFSYDDCGYIKFY